MSDRSPHGGSGALTLRSHGRSHQFTRPGVGSVPVPREVVPIRISPLSAYFNSQRRPAPPRTTPGCALPGGAVDAQAGAPQGRSPSPAVRKSETTTDRLRRRCTRSNRIDACSPSRRCTVGDDRLLQHLAQQSVQGRAPRPGGESLDAVPASSGHRSGHPSLADEADGGDGGDAQVSRTAGAPVHRRSHPAAPRPPTHDRQWVTHGCGGAARPSPSVGRPDRGREAGVGQLTTGPGISPGGRPARNLQSAHDRQFQPFQGSFGASLFSATVASGLAEQGLHRAQPGRPTGDGGLTPGVTRSPGTSCRPWLMTVLLVAELALLGVPDRSRCGDRRSRSTTARM